MCGAYWPRSVRNGECLSADRNPECIVVEVSWAQQGKGDSPGRE